MSNSLAIATVIATLKARLDTALQADPTGIMMTLGDPPDTSTAGAYLKLLRVTRNPGLTGAALPTRDSAGRLRERPMIPLTLHLAFAFTGTSLIAERLAGLVMIELVARPWLESSEITEYLTSLTDDDPLKLSDLASAPERVRVTLSEMSVDEQSKLWGMFGRSYAALSVFYEASPVFLEDREAGGPAHPVLSRNFTLVQLPPTLVAAHPAGPLVAGDQLTLRGMNLAAEHTRIELGTLRFEPDFLSSDRIMHTLQDTVRPGAQLVRVVHLDDDDDLIVASHPLSLIVAPRLTTASLSRTPDEGIVTLEGVTLPEPGERAELYLVGETLGFQSDDWAIVGAALRFTIPKEVDVGEYVVRLRIAGVFNRATVEAGGPGPRVS